MLKTLLAAFSGFSGVVGCASLSAINWNWNTKELWRITHNDKFYLSNCFNHTNSKTGQWIESNLWIYLTIKQPTATDIGESTELELWGEGWGEKWDNGKIKVPRKSHKTSLQGSIRGVSGEVSSDYQANKEHSFWLGEVGGGEDAETFGSMIKCDNKVFDLKGSSRTGIVNLDLNKVAFRLKRESDSDSKYKGYEVYSIQISTSTSDGKTLTWADGFNPKVIKRVS